MAGKFKHISYHMPAEEFSERFPLKKEEKGHTWDLFKGGMSKVIWVIDRKYSRKVVLKFLDVKSEKKYKEENPEYTTEFVKKLAADLSARFSLEAEVSAQLNHPCTVRVYETGIIANTFPFIAMECVDGRDLEQGITAVRKAGQFKLEEFLLMFYEMCSLMEVAHLKRIINRDLKPRNVILGKYGALKVIDWGLAKMLQDNPAVQANTNVTLLNVGVEVNTLENISMGTPGYMAPEQRFANGVADERTDIYLLAGILYSAVTGREPHKTDGTPNLKFESEAKDIITKGLAWDPGDRYQTAGEMKEDVRGLLGEILTQQYNPQASRWSNILRRKSSIEAPEPLILSDIVKKWAGYQTITPSGRYPSNAETVKFKSRRSRRQ